MEEGGDAAEAPQQHGGLLRGEEAEDLRHHLPVERGVAAEQGSPAELMQQGGIYAHMVRTQAESQRWAL